MAVLNEQQISERLASLPGWKHEGNAITAVIRLADFVRAMGFVQSVALLAEQADHHPDIDIRWNTVTLRLSTHSDGGVTEKDLELASRINTLLPSL